MSSLTIGALALAAAGGLASAEPCAPAVLMSGDPASVVAVGALLDARGVARVGTPPCPWLQARLERRGEALVVELSGTGAAPVERVVGSVDTAATVIEAFARQDVGAPLLAVRVLPRPPRVRPVTPGGRRLHLFAGFEAAAGSDDSSWMGLQAGACVELGPVCAAARLRHAEQVAAEDPTVISSSDPPWTLSRWRRASSELSLGVEVPLRIGRGVLTPGLSGGVSYTRAALRGSEATARIGGVRAEMHTTISVAVGAGMALELSVAFALSEALDRHASVDMAIPDDPARLLRFGAGVRFGGS